MMKKIFAILMTACLLIGLLCVAVFAAEEPAPGVVLRVSAQKGDDIVKLGDYKSFESGWEAAIDYAEDHDAMEENGYSRIVVDLFANWNAEDDGDLGNGGDGFEYGAIHITEDSRVTLNLNGHKIDRRLTEVETDGEVIYIDDNADVIINDGTITGGYSDNGAGGIHIMDGAKVTLNDVDMVGNKVENDDGAAIAVYGGATLVMNGGSLSNNCVSSAYIPFIGSIDSYGTLYANNSTVILNDVTIDGNYADTIFSDGLAIYATGSIVKMTGCTVSNNATKVCATDYVIYADDSNLTITDTDFIGNNTLLPPEDVVGLDCCLFYVSGSMLNITGGAFSQNGGSRLFRLRGVEADIKGATITDNDCGVMYLLDNEDEIVNMIECTLGNNTPVGNNRAFAIEDESTLVLMDCILGNTTFSKSGNVKITTSEVPREEGNIGIELLREDGTSASVRYYKDLESGWSYAIECALANAYDRVVIDLYTDWTAADGEFTDDLINGTGFKWNTLYIPQNVRITLNMNGHTINRNLTDNEDDGEVIYIDAHADVIINDGTIKGGNSENGAGGIHVMDGASVTLNNVTVRDNTVVNDDGAAIALYGGATLVMNGGSLENNLVYNQDMSFRHSYGTLYLCDSSATLTGVKITNNTINGYHTSRGVIIYLDDSSLMMKDCTVADNGQKKNVSANSLITVSGAKSVLDIANCKFENNQSSGTVALFDIDGGTFKMTDSSCVNNVVSGIFYSDKGVMDISNCRFENNDDIFYGAAAKDSKFDACTFSENSRSGNETFFFTEENQLEFTNCELGNATFNNRGLATFNGKAVGSIFGEGSATMIFSILALVAAVASIFLTVYYNKKRSAPVAPSNEETDDEE